MFYPNSHLVFVCVNGLCLQAFFLLSCINASVNILNTIHIFHTEKFRF